jgi:hypothetical protein
MLSSVQIGFREENMIWFATVVAFLLYLYLVGGIRASTRNTTEVFQRMERWREASRRCYEKASQPVLERMIGMLRILADYDFDLDAKNTWYLDQAAVRVTKAYDHVMRLASVADDVTTAERLAKFLLVADTLLSEIEALLLEIAKFSPEDERIDAAGRVRASASSLRGAAKDLSGRFWA